MTIHGRHWRRRRSRPVAQRAVQPWPAPRNRYEARVSDEGELGERLATPQELAALARHFNGKRGGDAR